MFHFLFLMVDVVLDNFNDKENLEEACCLSRLIQWLNPRLENKRGKDCYYQFRDVFKDIYTGLIGEFLRAFLGVDSLESDNTPDDIKQESDVDRQQHKLTLLVRKFIIDTHAEYSNCEADDTISKLPEFYPHHAFLRSRHSDMRLEDDAESLEVNKEDVIENNVGKPIKRKRPNPRAKSKDEKNDYGKSLMAFLGVFVQMVESVKEANGLDCYLLQKKVHKIVNGSGHKNYSCSIASYKQIVLGHRSPKFSHAFMWNLFAGRPGSGLKMARDQRVEHLNRFLKEGFKSLGVNLNEKNAKRINDGADVGQMIESKVNKFYNLDIPGKSHTKKDRTEIISKLTKLFRSEKVASHVPKRNFKGPTVSPSLETSYDETQYLSWHYSKTKELTNFYSYKANYSKS